MGTLHFMPSKGAEIFSFEYDKKWLSGNHAMAIDPALQLYTGQQFLANDKINFGAFMDSSPDRWGRVLMKRREAALAKSEERKARTLLESDFLLGVFDGLRMGALRFKSEMNGPFLDNIALNPTPQFASLLELEHASMQLEKDNAIGHPNYIRWLNMLVAPGGSLGGARPKAGIIDEKGELWIAKFPSRNDIRDIGAWEAVAHALAVKSGINVPDIQLKKITNKYHTFLAKRFDRKKNKRTHFASAMTLLGYTDGANHEAGVSYLELAEFIGRHGAKPEEDLIQLWRRIVFSICISNTDDHLRNHGFLLTPPGWTLSPAYDVNPNEDGTGLTLNISDEDNSLDVEVAISVAEHFRLDVKDAKKIVKDIQKAVAAWPIVAKKYGISKSEQEAMKNAFRV